jgi:hypothetical protein
MTDNNRAGRVRRVLAWPRSLTAEEIERVNSLRDWSDLIEYGTMIGSVRVASAVEWGRGRPAPEEDADA